MVSKEPWCHSRSIVLTASLLSPPPHPRNLYCCRLSCPRMRYRGASFPVALLAPSRSRSKKPLRSTSRSFTASWTRSQPLPQIALLPSWPWISWSATSQPCCTRASVARSSPLMVPSPCTEVSKSGMVSTSLLDLPWVSQTRHNKRVQVLFFDWVCWDAISANDINSQAFTKQSNNITSL